MKRISIVILALAVLLVAGCSGLMGGRNLIITGGATPSVQCTKNDSSIEIAEAILPYLKTKAGSGITEEAARVTDDRVTDDRVTDAGTVASAISGIAREAVKKSEVSTDPSTVAIVTATGVAGAIASINTMAANANIKTADANAKNVVAIADADTKNAIDFVNETDFERLSIECKEFLDRSWLGTIFY